MRQNLLSTFYSPLPSFSGPSRDGRGGGRRRATDGPGAALGMATIGGGQRASEWPPFAFYTAKIHLISRWWTEGAQRERRKACVAATPVSQAAVGMALPAPGALANGRRERNSGLPTAPATTTTSTSSTRKGICNCGTYSRCNLNCPPPPAFLIRSSQRGTIRTCFTRKRWTKTICAKFNTSGHSLFYP